MNEIKWHLISTGSYPNALIIRANAAYSGTAPILTTAAVIASMKFAPWWPQFEEAWRGILDIFEQYVDQVRAVGAAAHVAARIYGKRRVVVSDTFARIFAPYTLAYIRSLPRASPLRG